MLINYRRLTREQKITTFENYQKLCEEDPDLMPFDSFQEYDEEQMFLDMDFDTEDHLRCCG